MSSKAQPAKRATLNPDDRTLTDPATKLVSENRTDFVLDAARRAAGQALLDERLFRVDAATYAAFLKRLDASAQPNERLRRTMKTQAPWE